MSRPASRAISTAQEHRERVRGFRDSRGFRGTIRDTGISTQVDGNTKITLIFAAFHANASRASQAGHPRFDPGRPLLSILRNTLEFLLCMFVLTEIKVPWGSRFGLDVMAGRSFSLPLIYQELYTVFSAAGQRIILLTVFRKQRRQERGEIDRACKAMERCIEEKRVPEKEDDGETA